MPDCEGVEYHNRDHLLLITNGATPTIIKQNGGNGMKNKCYWTANKIKDVIKDLDSITWLEGRTLPVRFVNDENMLGDLVFMDGEPVEFQFSKRFLNDPNLPYAYVLDSIKRQYEKYMNYMLGGDIGNTRLFVECCNSLTCLSNREIKLIYPKDNGHNIQFKEVIRDNLASKNKLKFKN